MRTNIADGERTRAASRRGWAGRSLAGLTLAGVLALSAGLAHAQVTRSWNNPSGGAASNTLNWLPIGLPAQQDALVYNLNATYPVLFDPAVPVVRAQTFRRGTVSLQIALNHNTFDEFTIGQLAGDVAEARLTQGQLDTQDLILGLNSGSSGTLRLLGPVNLRRAGCPRRHRRRRHA